MLRFTIVLCLVALAAADNCCSAGDHTKLKASWNHLWNNADSSTVKVVFGKQIFLRMFELHPESRDLFTRVHVDDMDSPEFSAHMTRVLTGLDVLINLMGDREAVRAEIDHLNVQHLAREGVKAEYMITMVKVLHETLPQVLDDYDHVSFRNCLRGAVVELSHNLP